jgi:hypothetical protein
MGAACVLVLTPSAACAAFLDRVMYDVISLCNRKLAGPPMWRRRYADEDYDESLPSQLQRPDMMLLVSNNLLFKGEDNVHEHELAESRADLVNKLGHWGAVYNGQVRVHWHCNGSVLGDTFSDILV